MPTAPQQCGSGTAGPPLPIGAQHCGSALQEYHCPLLPNSVAVHCRSITARYSPAAWQCPDGVPLPTAPQYFGRALQKNHSTLLPSIVAMH